MRVFLCLFFLVGCGNEPSGTEAPPAPPPVVVPGAFAKVKVVIDEQCANAGCHAGAGFVQNAAAFKASSAKVRIANGSMPKRSGPNFDLYSDVKRKILLDFLK